MELDGMPALIDGVLAQRWPHTVNAQTWVDEWMKTVKEHPGVPLDQGAMLGWFSNAIMAGYDTAHYRDRKPEETPT